MSGRPVRTLVAVIVTIHLTALISLAAAQSKESNPATGSISGVVTRDGKPEPGVGVLLMTGESRPTESTAVARARSDKDGKFVFDGLARGSYTIDAFAPGLVVFDETPWDGAISVSLGDGESVRGVSIALNAGGAITGKLVDEEGRPIASQPIRVFARRPDGTFRTVAVFKTSVDSDDRGIYRVFGLPAGTYAVAAGLSEAEKGLNRSRGGGFDQRFHGGSTTAEEAKLVELAAGGEARSVDITMKRGAGQTYAIRGRVINSETKKPMAGFDVHFGPRSDGRFRSIMSVVTATSSGEFSFTGVPPGTHGVVASSGTGEQGSFSCDPVDLRVVDGDISDVVIEMTPAATISGVLAPVETDPGLDLSGIGDRVVSLETVPDPSNPGARPGRWSTMGIRVRPDRTFTITGVRPGFYRMTIPRIGPVRGFHVVRTELDGAPLAVPLRIEGTETIGNVRIVIGRAAGVIRGKVVGRNGSIQFSRVAVLVGTPESGLALSFERVDSAGTFLLEGMPPGETEVRATYNVDGGKPVRSKPVRVSVPSEGDVEVLLEIDLGPGSTTKGGGQ